MQSSKRNDKVLFTIYLFFYINAIYFISITERILYWDRHRGAARRVKMILNLKQG